MTPTVIFIHGLGTAGDIWAPQQEWCRKHHIESVALTLPGHGSRRDEVSSVDAMVNEIAAAARRFEKVILVGHSLGGFLIARAAPKIQNIDHIILINPLLDPAQIKRLFLASIKTAAFAQRFLGVRKRPGEFAQGSRWFWKWGIYPYCLLCNQMKDFENLFLEIKSLGRVSLPRLISTTILLSESDHVLTPAISENRNGGMILYQQFSDDRLPFVDIDSKSMLEVRSVTVPCAGHVLFRLAPEEVNRFLARALLRPQEHHA